MNRKLLLVLMTLLPMIMLSTVTSCSDDDETVQNPSNNDTSTDSDGQQNPDIVVTVDADGNADGGHRFTKIDVANFYIDDIKYTARGGDLVVSGYNEASFKGEAKIISILKCDGRTMNVVGIADDAFGSKISDITDLPVDGNTVSSGTGYSYNGCSNLTSITIPNCITSIGEDAFAGCTGLNSFSIPNSVISIGGYAFAGCTNLASISFGYSVTSIGDNAFCRCNNLKKVIISSIASWCGISFSAGNEYHPPFENDTNPLYHSHRLFIDENTEITNLVIPDGVNRIADFAFSHCSGLTSVTIPNSVKNIGSYAFLGCSRLNNVYCYAVNPPTVSNYSFLNTPISSATLHVPTGAVNVYKNTYLWSNFGRIVAIE